MQDDSLKKFNRIIAILTRLQTRKLLKAQDLASRFNVSLRTIYRDIRLLEKAGVPVIGEAGTGYSLMEGYRLPPVMFSREEVLSFITAEKLMQKLSGRSIGIHYESAMSKVKAVLRASEKDMIAMVESQIQIYDDRTKPQEGFFQAMEMILKSIADQKQIMVEYCSATENITQREIEPVNVFYANGFWYAQGYCHMRREYRHFRIDRLLRVYNTGKSYTQKHEEVHNYFKEYDSRPKVKVRILVHKQFARYLINSKLNFGFTSQVEKGNYMEMFFATCEIEEAFPRWFISFADHAEIIEPEQLKINVKAILKKIKEHIAAI